jgi:hypothetical protein
MKLKPHFVLIPSQVLKNYKLRLKLTKSQKLNIIRYSLKYIYIKYIK